MKVKLAFQKKCEGFWGDIIKWWTKSDYCHVEILLPLSVRGNVDEAGLWFSANDKKGVRLKPIVYPLDNEWWDYIELNLPIRTRKEYNELMAYINSIAEFKYAFLDLFRVQVLGLEDMEDRKRMYCSEAVANILIRTGEKRILSENKKAVSFSPEDLYKLYSDLKTADVNKNGTKKHKNIIKDSK